MGNQCGHAQVSDRIFSALGLGADSPVAGNCAVVPGRPIQTGIRHSHCRLFFADPRRCDIFDLPAPDYAFLGHLPDQQHSRFADLRSQSSTDHSVGKFFDERAVLGRQSAGNPARIQRGCPGGFRRQHRCLNAVW